MVVWLVVIVCICVILFCYHYACVSKISEEFVSPLDADSDYYDLLSLPTRSYEMLGVTPDPTTVKPFFLEFNDNFFIDSLTKCTYTPSLLESTIINELIQNTPNKIPRASQTTFIPIMASISKTIEGCMNTNLNKIGDSVDTLFSVTDIILHDVRQKDDIALTNSKCVVHRLGKSYGASILVTTFHFDGKTSIIDVQLEGFLFEDRIYGSTVPANLVTTEYALYRNLDTTILKDKKHEQETLCKYLQDLKKYRGIDYASLSDSKIVCDGKSSNGS